MRKAIDLTEFRDAGYLQELNRRFLHLLGLALEVEVEDEGGTVTRINRIVDFRDDPEGMGFEDEMLATLRARQAVERIDAEIEAKRERREALFGGIVQRVPEEVVGG